MGGNIDSALEKGTRKAIGIIRDAAKLNCPVSMSGGNLRATIKSSYESNNGIHTGKVFTNSEYGAYVEFGTGPKGEGTYPYPVAGLSYKADKWKVFIPDVGVRWISGQSAQPYLYPAAAENEELIFKIFAECIEEEIEKMQV